jgi:hypothetical protein
MLKTIAETIANIKSSLRYLEKNPNSKSGIDITYDLLDDLFWLRIEIAKEYGVYDYDDVYENLWDKYWEYFIQYILNIKNDL